MSLDIVVSDHILLGLCYKLCRPFVFPLEYRKQRWCIVYVCPYLNMLALFCGIGLCIWGLISIGAAIVLKWNQVRHSKMRYLIASELRIWPGCLSLLMQILIVKALYKRC